MDVGLVDLASRLVLYLPVVNHAFHALIIDFVILFYDLDPVLGVADQIQKLMRKNIAFLHFFNLSLFVKQRVLHVFACVFVRLVAFCIAGLDDV